MARELSHCQYRHFSASSPADPRLLFEQVQSLLDRSNRDRTKLFWAEGARSVYAAIEGRLRIQTLVYCPKLLRGRAWEAVQEVRASVPALRLEPDEFGMLSRRERPDGLGIVGLQRWERLIEQHPEGRDVWIALDGVRFPGNLGSIMRTCAATGGRGVMLIGGAADPYDPASIRGSMGALFKVSMIRTSARALAAWKARRPHVAFIGTATQSSLDYRAASYRKPLVLVMGSERAGLRERQIQICDHLVRLPMEKGVDSLNLASATSIMLYEIFR